MLAAQQHPVARWAAAGHGTCTRQHPSPRPTTCRLSIALTPAQTLPQGCADHHRGASLQVLIMGEAGSGGSVAVDDLILSPGCVLQQGELGRGARGGAMEGQC